MAWLPDVSPGKQSGAHSVDALGDVLVVGTSEGSEANGFVLVDVSGPKIFDLSNSRVPVEVGTWRPEDVHAPYYVHTIWTSHRDGRDVAVVGSEVFEDRHVTVPSPVWVLDVADVGAPEIIATWLNPGHQSPRLTGSRTSRRGSAKAGCPLGTSCASA